MKTLLIITLLGASLTAFSQTPSPAAKTPSPATEPSKVEVPPENLAKGTMPATGPAEEAARRILAAIVSDDPATVADLFFPAAAFDILKDIPRPGDYHRKLMDWYVADIHREHARIKGREPLEFSGFKPGFCKCKAVGNR